MKKIFKYIMSATLVVTGMMQFASCNDANDWTVDPSVTKQRPPTSLKVELADSASLDINVTIGTLTNAVSYELQVSESPLSSVEANDAATVTSDVWTFDGIKVSDFQGGKYVLKRDNGKFTIMQNTTYYFRVRAVGEDGTKSNWYTNGLLYNGSDGDEKIAQILLENSYSNNSNLNSTSSLTTPSLMWVGNTDIDPDALTINWHETDYTMAKYLRNESLEGAPEVDISNADKNPKYTKTTVWRYKWTGLEVNKEYTFSLLDENKNVIGTFTGKTEFQPDLSISYFFGVFPAIATSSSRNDIELDGISASDYTTTTTLFKGKIINNGKLKTESKSYNDNAFASPFEKDKLFLPLATEGYITTKTTAKGNRISTGSKDNKIELEIPADGRLYIYAGGKNTTLYVTQGSEEEENLKTSEHSVPATINKYDNGGTDFIKAYVTKGKATITWKESIYMCGIHFVPWEPVPNGSNAGQ